jgi:hypothetical protein
VSDTEERWRPVVGWESLYEVSNLGSVRSVARWVSCRDGRRLIEGRILKPAKSLGCYWRVVLCSGETQKSEHIHRLVAKAFVLGSGPLVRHLDGDGFNNRAENLAWGSFVDNESDKRRHGRTPRGEAHPNSKMTDGVVRQIRELHERGFSQLKIASSLGLNRGVVGVVVRGEGWTHVR